MEGHAGRALGQTDAGQLFLRKLEAGAAQRAQQRQILQGIVNHPQQVQHVGHLGHIEKLGVRVTVHGNAFRLQRFGDVRRAAGSIAHQQGNVPETQRAADLPLPDGGEAHQFLDFPGHKRRLVAITLAQLAGLGGFLILGFLGFGNHQVDFHRCAEGLSASGAQHGGLVIFDFGFLFPHGVDEHFVHRPQHVFIRPEILLQKNLSFLRTFLQRIIPVLLQEQRRVGQAEAVNALLHVAHHEQQIGETLVHRAQNGLLNTGHVLVFVNKERVKAPRHSGTHVGVLQSAKRQMLQVAVIKIIFLLLQFVKPLVHPLSQSAQSAQRRQRVAQIRFRFFLADRQRGAGTVHALLPFLPQLLVLLGHVGVFAGAGFPGAQAVKGCFSADQRSLARFLQQLSGQGRVALIVSLVAVGAVGTTHQVFHVGQQLRRAFQLLHALRQQHTHPGLGLRFFLGALRLGPFPGRCLGEKEIIQRVQK